MLVAVYYKQMSTYEGQFNSFIGYTELCNLDLLDNTPYSVYETHQNLYPYLTDIGKMKIESIYPALSEITEYIVTIVTEQEEQNIKKYFNTNIIKKYENLIDDIKQKFYKGLDIPNVQEKVKSKLHEVGSRTLSDIFKNGL